MGKKFLIDTNVIIDFSGNKFHRTAKLFVAKTIDNNPYFSVINKIELLSFSVVKKEIIELIESSTEVNLSEEIISKTISIRKTHNIKLPDAIIASTAIIYGLELITRNISDFKNIEGLMLINPWEK